MRSVFALTTLATALSLTSAFVPNSRGFEGYTGLASSVEALSGEEINARLAAAKEKMAAKDKTSQALTKEDLKVVFEDDHLIIVDKPAGVLCVPDRENNPSLSKVVFDAYGSEGMENKMVVHRLGMDTSGLVIFAKTMDTLRGMNSLFRTRKINRQYEALLCGNVEKDSGLINLPLMRDYEFPPYMRVSTDEHQKALIDLDLEVVGKQLLEKPKASLTKYDVVAREDIGGHPVSRVTLTSISGRTHQLNVHCAAFGHPIVADAVYGRGGDAAPNGGLSDAEADELVPNANRVGADLEKEIAAAAADMKMCVHAKSISFKHPVTKENVSVTSESPF